MNPAESVLTNIISMLDTAFEMCAALDDALAASDAESALTLLHDLGAAADAISGIPGYALAKEKGACIKETLTNISDTITRIRTRLHDQALPEALREERFCLFPFLTQLRAAFYFFGTVYPDPAKMAAYYRDDFSSQYPNIYFQKAKPKYRLSIVVPAYNHLDVTKQCIDRLKQETDFHALDAELILIDHGSSDGTYDYFRSLGADKVIRFSQNNRMFVFPTIAQIAEGEFFAFVSSDVLVTKDWASLLLSCMDSDPRIIAAVPKTPNTSNLQAVGLPSMEKDAFLSWADEHNRHDPSLWEDRARLMPTLGMYRTAAVLKLGFADPYFHTMEFWDDDFSLRARRAGYRQVLCGDVACFHFGSVTGGEAQVRDNTLVSGRELFFRKHGVDAYDTGAFYDFDSVSVFRDAMPVSGSPKLLGIDCGFGDTLFQMRNELRKKDLPADLYHLNTRQAFCEEMHAFCVRAVTNTDPCAGLQRDFPDERFSFVYLGRDISQYEDAEALFRAVSLHLEEGGHFLLFCDNPYFAPLLDDLLHFRLPDDASRITGAIPLRIHAMLGRVFSDIGITIQTASEDAAEAFVRKHYEGETLPDRFTKELAVKRYYFLCSGRKVS